jgi:hypothetical protein
MGERPVTSAEFRRFVMVTSYVRVAERLPNPAGYPDADANLLVPDSLVFREPLGRDGLDDYRIW